MTRLRLYSNPDCHLCEQAEALLAEAGLAGAVEVVNIEDNPAHLRRYVVSIPVLQRMDSGAELGWPFDLGLVEEFLSGLF